MNFRPITDEDHPVLQEHENVTRALTRGRELLDKWELYDWTMCTDRAIERVGQCRHGKKEIAVSHAYLELTPWEEIEDTILHEIAHALVGPGHGHDYVWQNMCRIVGARPQRLASPSAQPNVEYRYRMICPMCSKIWKRHRMRKRNLGGKCPYCNVKVEIYDGTERIY